MKTKISVLAIDLGEGSFQVCAGGAEAAGLASRRAAELRGGDGGLYDVAPPGASGADALAHAGGLR